MSLTALTTTMSLCELESPGASHRLHSRRLESQNHDQPLSKYCIVLALSKYGMVLGILNRGFPDVPILQGLLQGSDEMSPVRIA